MFHVFDYKKINNYKESLHIKGKKSDSFLHVTINVINPAVLYVQTCNYGYHSFVFKIVVLGLKPFEHR